ncbi:hypothetical protein DEA8626_03423 [Defluviimonas aquaemixtae]|uniref:SPW repeat-containing integral membrane domain-containing protein n=1 Tax=Albidovulum aquaemixtae TaxID=1542388 RepID=A0A2R8BLT7_9RHOB|nr:SPW repeat protein [Defluviimonas aquaemixtae]SPH24372.1 hypothetical protein DEA8626_03423 [Defluviimonas aquaemixtae]
MTNFFKKATESWQDGLCLVLGVWLFLSPWLLGFAVLPAAFWNAVLFGVIIAGMAIMAIVEFRDWEEWADMAIGVWLVISPWVLGFAALSAVADASAFAATWNFVATGILTLALSAWSLRSHHDGTRAA